MPLEVLIGIIIIGSLTLYALLGGADYGGGIWDLFSSGPRADRQRDVIAHAIKPVWEVNHIWLILVIVLLWTAFPPAFAAITTALHIPLFVLLLGIVFRGVSFTFRAYDTRSEKVQRMWGYVFSIASILTPFVLGVIVGSITDGRLMIVDGASANGYIAPWLAPFPLVVGGFAISLFAYLAAVYLTVEATEDDVKEDFRRRAIIAGISVALFALATFLVSITQAPGVKDALLDRWWSLTEQSLTALASIAAFYYLLRRNYTSARFAAAAQVALIIWGWALAQFPYLVRPGLTLTNSAAPRVVEQSLLVACVAGAVVLLPSMRYLYKIFKAPGAIHAKSSH